MQKNGGTWTCVLNNPPRRTTKLTWDPGPLPKTTITSLQISNVIKNSFNNDLQKNCGNLRLSQKKKHENKHRLKTHDTFVGKQFLIGTFFCSVFFWTDFTFVVYWSKTRVVSTKPGDHDTLGNGNPDWIGTFLPFRAPAASFFSFFLFFDLLTSFLVLSDPSHLCFSHLSILSEVWLLNFLRSLATYWWWLIDQLSAKKLATKIRFWFDRHRCQSFRKVPLSCQASKVWHQSCKEHQGGVDGSTAMDGRPSTTSNFPLRDLVIKMMITGSFAIK